MTAILVSLLKNVLLIFEQYYILKTSYQITHEILKQAGYL